MHTHKTIHTEIEDTLDFGWWDMKKEEFVTMRSEDGQARLLAALKCSPDLLQSLQFLIDDIKEKVGTDLQTIWGRLDELEARTQNQITVNLNNTEAAIPIKRGRRGIDLCPLK